MLGEISHMTEKTGPNPQSAVAPAFLRRQAGVARAGTGPWRVWGCTEPGQSAAWGESPPGVGSICSSLAGTWGGSQGETPRPSLRINKWVPLLMIN